MLKIWFMYDNHTFAKVKVGDRASLIEQAEKLFTEDGCGSLFSRDEFGGTLRALDLHGRQMKDGRFGVTKDDVERWADQVLIEDSFRHKMHA